MRRAAFLIVLGICALPAHAEREMSRRVRSIHAPIPTLGASLQGAKLAILYALLKNKDIKWMYESETKNSIMARWDYRGDSVLANIVYDQNQIQIHFVDGSADMTCQDLEAGVCHKNSGAYFNYIPHLRKAITREIRWYRTKEGAPQSAEEEPEQDDAEVGQ